MSKDAALLSMEDQVTRLVRIASGGKINEEDLQQTETLGEAGLDSLGYLNLLEGIERSFGVEIDLDQEENHHFLASVESIVRYLKERGA